MAKVGTFPCEPLFFLQFAAFFEKSDFGTIICVFCFQVAYLSARI